MKLVAQRRMRILVFRANILFKTNGEDKNHFIFIISFLSRFYRMNIQLDYQAFHSTDSSNLDRSNYATRGAF